MVKATGSIRANQSAPKSNTPSDWPNGQRALERACYLRASRPKARHQMADFCSAPLAGFYAAVDRGQYWTPIRGQHWMPIDTEHSLPRRWIRSMTASCELCPHRPHSSARWLLVMLARRVIEPDCKKLSGPKTQTTGAKRSAWLGRYWGRATNSGNVVSLEHNWLRVGLLHRMVLQCASVNAFHLQPTFPKWPAF